MSKKYEEAKIVYANSVSSEAIKRITTFDGLTKHFSSVRNVTTGDTVSATALTTVGKKAKRRTRRAKAKKFRSVDKGKTPTAGKADRVFIPIEAVAIAKARTLMICALIRRRKSSCILQIIQVKNR
jgi:hypothetical protein